MTLGEHRGPRKTRQDTSSLGCAARRLTLSRYVARLKPRCGSLALSVMWYVLTVSQVGVMARFARNLLCVKIRSRKLVCERERPEIETHTQVTDTRE